MNSAGRISNVPEYIFSRVDDIKKELQARGINIIDLGIGDPDIPTPEFVIDALKQSIIKPQYHKYPPYRGTDIFRKEVAAYYKRRFGVFLDPETEIAALIGSKEGIAHMFLALTEPGDTVILPDPAYPVYKAAAIISGCGIYNMKLDEENGYIPKFEDLDFKAARDVKLLMVNYPNNPTGAEADLNVFRRLIDYGKENDVVIINDGAYLEIGYGDFKPKSILQVPGAKEIAVEFGSLSKPYNMTGWRLGFVAGSKEVIDKLMIVKTNFDSGQFGAIQEAGVAALRYGDEFIGKLNQIYKARRNLVSESLRSMGIRIYDSSATFYVWFRIPEGFKSKDFASFLLEKTGVIITPGTAYGTHGEGYCRISLTVPDEALEEAMRRIGNLKFINEQA